MNEVGCCREVQLEQCATED